MEGVQPEDIQGAKQEDGKVKEEDPDLEVDPPEKAAEEEAKGSGDAVLFAEGVQRCPASECLAAMMGGVRAARGCAIGPSIKPPWMGRSPRGGMSPC